MRVPAASLLLPQHKPSRNRGGNLHANIRLIKWSRVHQSEDARQPSATLTETGVTLVVAVRLTGTTAEEDARTAHAHCGFSAYCAGLVL